MASPQIQSHSLQGHREALERTILLSQTQIIIVNANYLVTAAQPFCPSWSSPSPPDTGPTPPLRLGSPPGDPLMYWGAPRPRAALNWLLQSQAPPPDPRPADRRYLPYIKGSVNGFFKKNILAASATSLENMHYFGGVRHPPCLWIESGTPMTSQGERRLAGKAGARPWQPEPPREASSLSEQQQ